MKDSQMIYLSGMMLLVGGFLATEFIVSITLFIGCLVFAIIYISAYVTEKKKEKAMI